MSPEPTDALAGPCIAATSLLGSAPDSIDAGAAPRRNYLSSVVIRRCGSLNGERHLVSVKVSSASFYENRGLAASEIETPFQARGETLETALRKYMPVSAEQEGTFKDFVETLEEGAPCFVRLDVEIQEVGWLPQIPLETEAEVHGDPPPELSDGALSDTNYGRVVLRGTVEQAMQSFLHVHRAKTCPSKDRTQRVITLMLQQRPPSSSPTTSRPPAIFQMVDESLDQAIMRLVPDDETTRQRLNASGFIQELKSGKSCSVDLTTESPEVAPLHGNAARLAFPTEPDADAYRTHFGSITVWNVAGEDDAEE